MGAESEGPGERILSTAIDEADSTASIDLAFEVARHFGLKPAEARAVAAEAAGAVSGWRSAAKALGLSSSEIGRMESAFEHEDLAKAK